MNNNNCPLCENGILTEIQGTHEVRYKNRIKLIDDYYSVCNNCASELTNHEQSVLNKQAVIEFRESVDNLIDNK